MILHGSLTYHTITASSLEANPLDDPVDRQIVVYKPPNYKATKHFPLLVDLAPYTSSGLARVGWKSFTKSIPEIIDDMIIKGDMDPAIIIFPDTFTKLGGNQHINSKGLGKYADFIMQEVVPYIENTYNCGGKGYRGIYGYSSGGYAALVYGMTYSEYWDAIACHSGDMGFDIAYLPDMGKAVTHFANYNFDSAKFITELWASGNPSGQDIGLLMMLAMAATYDPDSGNPKALEFKLPVDYHTLEVDHEKWKRWIAHDPLTLIDNHSHNLKSLKSIFIDCGLYDEYHLQYAARRFVNKLNQHNIPHVYQEFEGTHRGIAYRIKHSLPQMVTALNSLNTDRSI